MTQPTARNWWVFGLCAGLLVGAMLWLSAVLIRLDHEKAEARAMSEHQIAISKALWRMDSWLAPQLAREAARPYFEYQSLYPQEKAYTLLLNEIQAGEVLTPSPLLSFESKIFPLHFQYDEKGRFSSPQVPTGNLRDLAEATLQVDLDLKEKSLLLQELRVAFQASRIEISAAYRALKRACLPPEDMQNVPVQGEYASRARSMDQAKHALGGNKDGSAMPRQKPGQVVLGPLLPYWLRANPEEATGRDTARLIFVRQVRLPGRTIYQGVLADWPALRADLLIMVRELFPEMRLDLLPRPGNEGASGESSGERMLATVPAQLEAPLSVSEGRITGPTYLVLSLAWSGLAVTLIAVAFSIHSTVRFGQRRARFASAVTHELRTPLTTFRMYSEMLADDMVSDPEQRRVYLNTLKSEANRLSRLVENVLSYARIEDGRFNSHPERIGLSAMMERIRPILEQRVQETEHELVFRTENSVECEVDVDAISQILFNLVDNACKYAKPTTNPRIEITAKHTVDSAFIQVRDYGPGIPECLRKSIFRPFERANQEPGDNETPGVGLGLALALALANDLGGRLTIDASVVDGASFTLSYPLNSS